MNGQHFRMPARRLASVAAATALAAGPTALACAGTAHATSGHGHGRASAVVLRTALDVNLLNKTVDVPLAVTLNEVTAPQSAEKTALTAELDGVAGGRPFTVLRAKVAEARATVDDTRAEASTRLAHARLHVPGLPLLSVIEVGAVSSRATCEASKAPVAESSMPGSVTVLGKKVSVSAGGTTDVKVPGVGEVRLDLSQRETTSRTAAATALELTVSVNPLKLNVAEVTGKLTLAQATCKTPKAPEREPEEEAEEETGTGTGTGTEEETGTGDDSGTEENGGTEDNSGTEASEAPAADDSGAEPATDVKAQGAPAGSGLAETGGSSTTPYIAGGAVALLAAGGGAVALARRNRG
ncbi:SCO1860 family LAETG-anchored protein [Streptomyces sp. CAI-85]|uniref:SCO1860 family LAETG-anchored protein n=1 Tax=Streptomyces sp. CAI-85 TaxID=1472662 RepID=UPI0015872806|nr:SCO1860 family LAETG-anchored protein [Streptomyces sp. CAI-85]NUV62925.1 LPXTG cell wall anchor domain-containing protein [Streptomyces sp. CAI-85]